MDLVHRTWSIFDTPKTQCIWVSGLVIEKRGHEGMQSQHHDRLQAMLAIEGIRVRTTLIRRVLVPPVNRVESYDFFSANSLNEIN